MNLRKAKDLMIPLSEYATVNEDATLSEAVKELIRAQGEFDNSRYRHRAILVFDKDRRVVGKISQLDVIMALEPNYLRVREQEVLSRSGLSAPLIRSMLKQHHLWDRPLATLCENAANQKVREIMHTPEEGDFIKEDSSLDEIIYRLIEGSRHSLLVVKDKDIVGILRLTDIFDLVSQEFIKHSETDRECSSAED